MVQFVCTVINCVVSEQYVAVGDIVWSLKFQRYLYCLNDFERKKNSFGTMEQVKHEAFLILACTVVVIDYTVLLSKIILTSDCGWEMEFAHFKIRLLS